jgi:flagellar protein FliO/FliZ
VSALPAALAAAAPATPISGAAGDLAMFVRVGGSLLAVLILLALVARLARRASRRGPGTGLAVLERTGLGKDAAVAVVSVAGRALVVGVTPHSVTMLTELDPESVPEAVDLRDRPDPAVGPGPEPAPGQTRPAGAMPARRARSGSVLSPATWKQGIEALRDKTSRT